MSSMYNYVHGLGPPGHCPRQIELHKITERLKLLTSNFTLKCRFVVYLLMTLIIHYVYDL